MNNHRRSLQLIGVWCVLLAYAMAASPFGVGVAAVLGSADTSHCLRVNLDARGVQIVLHHGPTYAVHRHGAVARALTLFAQPASAANPDHVLQFSASGTSPKPEQFTAPAPAEFDLPAIACIELAPPDPRGAASLSVPPRPPPEAVAPLLLTRSTVLLI